AAAAPWALPRAPFLPGPLEPRSSRSAPPHAPALAELLALAGPPSRSADGLDAAIASSCGIERQSDWPLAAIRAASLGLRTGDAYWLAADPVTLVVGRDDVALSGIVENLTRTHARPPAHPPTTPIIDESI